MSTQSEPVCIHLLGGFSVSRGLERVPASAWRLRTASLLVKLLALSPGYRLHREQIMDVLWSDSDPDAASRNLRYTLHTARKVLAAAGLPADDILMRAGESLSLGQAGSVLTDVPQFEAATRRAWQTTQREDFIAAAALYGGDLLPEDRYEDWVEEWRNTLRIRYLTLLGRLASAQEMEGDSAASIATLQQVLTLEPADEQTHARLMRLYSRTGQRRQALAQYERLSDVLETEFAAVPEDATRELALAIQAGAVPMSDDVAGRDGRMTAMNAGFSTDDQPSPPTNLPTPLAPLIGRERESAEVVQFLSTHRLVTLIGTGGVGKTRLAVEVASEVAGQFPGGVFWIELAAQRDAELVMPTIANTLGVRADGDQPLIDAVIARLKTTTTLLVLDNFEHLIDAAPLVTALLTACPALRVLATSRVRLRLHGEQRYPVAPLELPGSDVRDASALVRYPSVQLFAERAREVDPRFRLTDEAAPPVAAICQRLDGLPLAIELAAARVDRMSTTTLLVQLERRLPVLVDGPRDLANRQQTLRNTIGWSYDLLSNDDQQLFPTLAVFAGGWSVEAVAAVAQVGEDRVYAGLERLVEQHLVTRVWLADQTNRYTMLETIREYGIERLEDLHRADSVRRRHATQFLDLAERAEPELDGPQQREWLTRLDREHDNLRSALAWALTNTPELALRMAGSLGRFWHLRGYFSEGRTWFVAALDSQQPMLPANRAKALRGEAMLALAQGDYNIALERLEEALVLFRQESDAAGSAHSLRALGIHAEHQGNHTLADQHFAAALQLFQDLADPRGVASVLHMLGESAILQGDPESGKALMEECLDLLYEHGDPGSVSASLHNLGIAHAELGDTEMASACFEKAAQLGSDVGYDRIVAAALTSLGWVRLNQGNVERARAHFVESLRLTRAGGEVQTTLTAVDGVAAVAGYQGETTVAATLFCAASALRGARGLVVPDSEDEMRERHIDATRARADEIEWESAWTLGSSMSLEQAVEAALLAEGDAD